jgi:STE24 endopeptidase
MNWFAVVTLGLIGARCLAQLYLGAVNRRHVIEHRDVIPDAFKGAIEPGVYAKSVEYTLAKSRLNQFETVYEALILVAALFCGILPWSLSQFSARFGESPASMAAWLWIVGLALTIPHLPLEWFAQFRLEERFGFNTTTLRTWIGDRVKGILLAVLLGYPLLILILKIAEWTGAAWWVWAWAAIMLFQLLMLVLAPVIIMPLFNKFSPLPEGSLRARLLELAQRTGFRAQNIQVMDGSKRSRHSNAFFTGFGRFRRIVLFDTLVQQLTEPELEAVLAHEIGHYKKKHILRFIVLSAGLSFAGFYLLSVAAQQPWF